MSNLWARAKQCRVIVSAAMLSVLLALVAGCGDGNSGGGTSAPATQATGTVTGQVVSSANNAPVSGATVKTDSGTTTTAPDGKFSVSSPVGDRTLVRVEANGFADAFPVARVKSGQTTNLGVKLVPVGVTAPLSPRCHAGPSGDSDYTPWWTGRSPAGSPASDTPIAAHG